MRIFFIIITLLLSACLLGVSSIHAEEQTEASLEAITVTAQKQEENIQDVPVAMSVYDAFMIQDRMMDTLLDAGKYTPGLDIVSYGVSMRAAP